MVPRVLEAWRRDLARKAGDPDTRLILAQQIMREASPFAERKTWDTINTFAPGAAVSAIDLVNIEKRDNWVTVLESFDFRYLNPTNNPTIDAYTAQPLLSRKEEWVFPRFTLNEALDYLFGPRKLLNGPYVIVREQPAKLVLNPNTSALGAPAAFQVLTRFVVRYEPQWLMELMGLVEPLGFPDKREPVLGAR